MGKSGQSNAAVWSVSLQLSIWRQPPPVPVAGSKGGVMTRIDSILRDARSRKDFRDSCTARFRKVVAEIILPAFQDTVAKVKKAEVVGDIKIENDGGGVIALCVSSPDSRLEYKAAPLFGERASEECRVEASGPGADTDAAPGSINRADIDSEIANFFEAILP